MTTDLKLRKTKRYAPKGYIAIDKPSAKRAFDAGLAVTICGSNVNSFHVFGGWGLGCTIDKAKHEGEYGNDFDAILNNFLFYLDPELGRYAVFYVKVQPEQQMLENQGGFVPFLRDLAKPEEF